LPPSGNLGGRIRERVKRSTDVHSIRLDGKYLGTKSTFRMAGYRRHMEFTRPIGRSELAVTKMIWDLGFGTEDGIKIMKNVRTILMLSVFVLFGTLLIKGQNSAFTFQGKLADAGVAANGPFDLQFILIDALTGGTVLGTLVKDDVVVTQGIFTVTLDYGSDVFTNSTQRYLEIAVRPGASTGAYMTIAPRQQLTSSPYSIESAHAAKAGSADRLAGLPSTSFLRSDASQTFTGGNLTIGAASVLNVQGSLLGDGLGLTNLKADNISSGTVNDARLSGNIPKLNAYNIFTGGAQFNSPPLGSGEFLTNLTASNLTGTIPDARLSTNIPKLNTGNTFGGANNNFTGRISANTLSVGPGLPITKILTASASLDFGSGRLFQQVLYISVPGARVGDAVQLGIPANILPQQTQDAEPPDVPSSVATQPYIFQAYVSSPDTVSVTWILNLYPYGDGGGPIFPPAACLPFGSVPGTCQDPPAGVFRVVVFSFAP
jgi:hypothetical protein